jgi:excisionase family DNA binding protein
MKIELDIPQFDTIIKQQQELIEILKNKNNRIDKFLTAQEIADILKISYGQVVTMARKGELPGKKIGTMWRFSSGQIQEWFHHNNNSDKLPQKCGVKDIQKRNRGL